MYHLADGSVAYQRCNSFDFSSLILLSITKKDSIMQILEKNLPMDNVYKSEDVTAAPIRVIHLLYNAGVSL